MNEYYDMTLEFFIDEIALKLPKQYPKDNENLTKTLKLLELNKLITYHKAYNLWRPVLGKGAMKKKIKDLIND